MQHPTAIPGEFIDTTIDVVSVLKKSSSSGRLRLALFISGGGTTAEAILKACKSGKLAIDPVLVVASKAGISGIERAKRVGIANLAVEIIEPKQLRSMTKNTFGDVLLSTCQRYNVDIIGQYGWLPLTPKKLIKEYEGRIVNQHPGPLDPPHSDFGGRGMWGRRVHAAVLLFRRMTGRDFWTEATCHFVTEEFDKGGVLKRKRVEILPGDIIEDLQKRALRIEHEAQIEALQDFVKEDVRVEKREKPLIQKDDLKELEEAKRIAAMLYPNG